MKNGTSLTSEIPLEILNDVSKIVKANKVRDVDNVTVCRGFNKGLVNSDVSQVVDCKPVYPVSKNFFDQIEHVAKDFVPIKFMKEGTIQQQSLDAPKERPKVSKNVDSVGSSNITSHSVLCPANLSNDEVNNIFYQQGNWDKVVERLKNKRVEETTKATKLKKPYKACFKCGEEGHVAKHYGKGNKNCFSGLKSARNNSLNDEMNNHSSRSPYVKLVSHNSRIKTKKDSPRYSHAPVSKSPRPSTVKHTYVPKSFASKLKQNIVSNFKSFQTKICKPT
ncbi:hypothetical protein L1987_18836 [Smallanthus sonchifolius]|uniref:Uncharacterized protein n=1 Tax=Smallanthus sonchifolius TaxID=185202 RepID=A0ACB9J2V9_9ASTR|nr:hypothetical protein L1987_18836 [Smallanthus sonchifolius]